MEAIDIYLDAIDEQDSEAERGHNYPERVEREITQFCDECQLELDAFCDNCQVFYCSSCEGEHQCSVWEEDGETNDY